MPTFRERLARWLYPSAFVQAAPVTQQQPDTVPEPTLVPRAAVVRTLPDVMQPAKEEKETDIPPEYEALVRVQWGDMPFAASLTRARVRAILANPHASRRDVLQAIEGHVIEIL